ncbi:MAG: diaminopimelate epimerase [Canibacter sp.]
MVKLKFYKGHCNGSDTIVVMAPNEQPLTGPQISQLCNRNTGPGAQSLTVLHRVEDDPQAAKLRKLDPELKWVAQVFNAQGELTSQRSTALRVAANVLIETGRESFERRDTIPFATTEGITDVLIGSVNTSIDLGRWKLDGERLVLSAEERVQRPGLGISIDAEYTVVAVASSSELDSLNLSRTVEVAPHTEGEQLVIYVTPSENVIKDGIGQIHARTHSSMYGETQATGAALAAGALAFRHWGGPEMPHHWRVTTKEGSAAVRMYPTEEGEHVSTAAPVSLSFVGETLTEGA